MKMEAGRIFVRLRKINGLFPVDGVYFTNRTHTITYWIINQVIIYLKTLYRNLVYIVNLAVNMNSFSYILN